MSKKLDQKISGRIKAIKSSFTPRVRAMRALEWLRKELLTAQQNEKNWAERAREKQRMIDEINQMLYHESEKIIEETDGGY